MVKYMPVEMDKHHGEVVRGIDRIIETECGDVEAIGSLMSSETLFNIFKASAEHDRHSFNGMEPIDIATSLIRRHVGPSIAYMSYWWRKSQRPIFSIGEDLCRAMMETKVTVPISDVKLPYRSLYVHVPKSIGLTIKNKLLGDTSADGCLLTLVNGELMIIVFGWPKEEHDYPNAIFNRYIIPADLEGDIEEYLDDNKEKLAALVNDGAEHEASLWFRIAINTILYTESDGADVDDSPDLPDKKKARADKLSKRQRDKYIEKHRNPWSLVRVGHSVKIHEGISKAIGELRTRFIVRGHWRNQAHGPNRSLRKRLWIQPFWKGPEWAEVMEGRVYKLEGK